MLTAVHFDPCHHLRKQLLNISGSRSKQNSFRTIHQLPHRRQHHRRMHNSPCLTRHCSRGTARSHRGTSPLLPHPPDASLFQVQALSLPILRTTVISQITIMTVMKLFQASFTAAVASEYPGRLKRTSCLCQVASSLRTRSLRVHMARVHCQRPCRLRSRVMAKLGAPGKVFCSRNPAPAPASDALRTRVCLRGRAGDTSR